MLSHDLPPSTRKICEITAEHYGIGYQQLVGPQRHRKLVRARQVAAYLASTVTGRSLPQIGRSIGGRDHSTILHACRKISAELERDAKLSEDVALLGREITLQTHAAPKDDVAPLTGQVADHLDRVCRIVASEAEATRLLSQTIADTIERLEAQSERRCENVVKAAWSLVVAGNQVAEAGRCQSSLAEARARQAAAYRRLKAVLRAHEQNGGGQVGGRHAQS